MDGATLRELATKVSSYFLEFLETDFKRQQAPRRRLIMKTEAGLKAAVRVSPYPKLRKELWAALETGDAVLKLRPKVFLRPVSLTLRAILKAQIEAIEVDALLKVATEILTTADRTRAQAVENAEQWVEDIQLAVAESIADNVIRPLLGILEGPFAAQAHSAEDSIYNAEADLIERISFDLHQVMPEILSRYLAKGDPKELIDALGELLSLKRVQAALLDYFQEYAATDAFDEFQDLETHATNAEGLQLYLYVGTVKYASATYPMFYVPLDAKRLADGSGYDLTLINRLYFHKRAIEFILQELNTPRQQQWINPVEERIEYLADGKSLLDTMQPIFRNIALALNLGGQVDLIPGPDQQASTTKVALNTGLYLAVSDSGDEALANDYEQMIAEAKRDEPGVLSLFEGIISGVILDNPASIGADVCGFR